MQPSTGLMKKKTMIQYVQIIIVPFVEQTKESLGEDEDKAAVVIMDNFKGQVTPAMTELLERHHIHSCSYHPTQPIGFNLRILQ